MSETDVLNKAIGEACDLAWELIEATDRFGIQYYFEEPIESEHFEKLASEYEELNNRFSRFRSLLTDDVRHSLSIANASVVEFFGTPVESYIEGVREFVSDVMYSIRRGIKRKDPEFIGESFLDTPKMEFLYVAITKERRLATGLPAPVKQRYVKCKGPFTARQLGNLIGSSGMLVANFSRQ